MTPTEINREFAEKVMGFTKHGTSSWLNPNDGEVWFFGDFDPYHRWDHAAMGLEKFNECDIRKRHINGKVRYGCAVFGKLGKEFRGEADTAPAAICLACIEAKKEEE